MHDIGLYFPCHLFYVNEEGDNIMDLQKNLSNSMRFIRASRHQSITEFSEELGIARSTLQLILSGKANPTIDTIELIAEQLCMDPLLLLSSDKSYTDSAALVAEVIHKISFLDNAQRERFLTLFQELVLLLSEVNIDV